MNKYSYSISSAWAPDSQSPSEIARNGVRTLDLLNPIGPPFADWSIVDAEENYIPIEQARDQAVRLVEENVSRDDGIPWPRGGYAFWASTLAPPKAPLARSASLNMNAGSPDKNRMKLEVGGFGAPPELDLITYRGFKAALIALASTWPCPWANAHAFIDGYWRKSTALDEPPARSSRFQMPWVCYLSAPLTAGLKVPPEIVSEPGPKGGVILSAVTERFDPTNPSHLRRSKLLAGVMVDQVDGGVWGSDPPPLLALIDGVHYDISDISVDDLRRAIADGSADALRVPPP